MANLEYLLQVIQDLITLIFAQRYSKIIPVRNLLHHTQLEVIMNSDLCNRIFFFQIQPEPLTQRVYKRERAYSLFIYNISLDYKLYSK